MQYRQSRHLKGDEIFSTQDSIRQEETLSLIKRNYFRHKVNHFIKNETSNEAPTVDQFDNIEERI